MVLSSYLTNLIVHESDISLTVCHLMKGWLYIFLKELANHNNIVAIIFYILQGIVTGSGRHTVFQKLTAQFNQIRSIQYLALLVVQ